MTGLLLTYIRTYYYANNVIDYFVEFYEFTNLHNHYFTPNYLFILIRTAYWMKNTSTSRRLVDRITVCRII
jgi:hypothetical protein